MPSNQNSEPSLTGRRMLVVEDEWLIAVEMEQWLANAGAVVLGPLPSVELALRLLQWETPDGALLDINLRGKLVTPVARTLIERGVPCLLVTAYDGPEFNDSLLRRLPCVRKPISPDQLVRMAARMWQDDD